MLSDYWWLCLGVPDQASLRSPWAWSTYPPTRHQPGWFRCHWCLWWLFMLSMMTTKMMKIMWSSNGYSTGGLRAHEPQLYQVRPIFFFSLIHISPVADFIDELDTLLHLLCCLSSASSSSAPPSSSSSQLSWSELRAPPHLLFSHLASPSVAFDRQKIPEAKNRVSIQNIRELHLHFIK